jgi:hypothetical protein
MFQELVSIRSVSKRLRTSGAGRGQGPGNVTAVQAASQIAACQELMYKARIETVSRSDRIHSNDCQCWTRNPLAAALCNRSLRP